MQVPRRLARDLVGAGGGCRKCLESLENCGFAPHPGMLPVMRTHTRLGCPDCPSLLRKGAVVLMLMLGVMAGLGCENASDAAHSQTRRIVWMVPVSSMRHSNEELAQRFGEAHPEIQLNLMWVPATQYQAKFKTLVAAGQAPDLIQCGDVWVAYMLPFLQDISNYVQRDAAEVGLDDFFPQVRDACQHHGRYYFLASKMNVSLLYYNTKLFDAAGVSHPTPDWTWNEFVDAAVKITRPATDDQPAVWGCDMEGGWWGEWLIHVRQAGGDLFNEDITRCTLDSPQAIQGLQFYFDKIHRHKFTAPPGRGPTNRFAGGQIGMVYGGHVETWRTFNVTLGNQWDVQLLPIGPAGRTGGEIAVEAYGITRDCKDVEAAWTFLKFVASRENMRAAAKAGSLPTRQSIAHEIQRDPNQRVLPRNFAAVFEQVKHARAIPRSPNFIEIALEIVQPEIDRMLLGDLTPEQAAHRAAEAANRFLTVLGNRRENIARPESR